MPVAAPEVRERAEWAQGLPPVGPLQPEEDVRFLLVHHTASSNVGAGTAVAQLRSFYGYHTGTKGWPDIAYNFLIDPDGQIWEGRQGSLAGPVRGDATGGSQGHALLCCFIGDFAAVSPNAAALDAMTRLLAWLAQTYAVDLAEDSRITFTSRGSNRWPAGASVTTTPIAGHRDMSQTTCPGDAAYALIASTLWPGARALLDSVRPTSSPAPTGASEPTASPSLAESAGPGPSPTEGWSAQAAAQVTPEPGISWPLAVAGAGGVAVAAGLGWVINRRMRAGGSGAGSHRQ